ncbi:MAG TPA: glycosyltransferase, partial [Thermoplasmata archaeon]|nr:glycosyltransferase [Thermoplasmata archaeon]
MSGTGTNRPRVLVGGVAAYNEEPRIERSVRSLLEQELPEGIVWGKLWVVASGCTDRTAEIVERLAEEDPRVGLVVESRRNGKATALDQIFRRAEGDLLLLLDGDSVAAPGAVHALCEAARRVDQPFAVMGCPVPPHAPEGKIYPEVELLYRLHHEYHSEVLSRGEGT